MPAPFARALVATGSALTVLVLLTGPAAHAESSDVGQTLDTAGVGAATLTGTLGAEGDVDLYKICIAGDHQFGVHVDGAGGDGQLFLFDADGTGVLWNDDSSTGDLVPQLPAGSSPLLTGLAGGTYYLAIDNFNFDPFSANGSIFADSTTTDGDPVDPAEGPGADSPLAGWTGEAGGFPGIADYTMSLNGLCSQAPMLQLPADFWVAPDSSTGAGSVTYTATATAPDGSTVTPTCSPGSGSAFGFGTTSVTCSATANGATATGSFAVSVGSLGFQGFYSPIDNAALNEIKAGSTVPVKFNLTAGGSQLSDPAAITAVTSAPISCPGDAVTTITGTTAAPSDAVRWDGSKFIDNWRTPRTPGQCVQLRVTTADSVVHTAAFRLA